MGENKAKELDARAESIKFEAGREDPLLHAYVGLRDLGEVDEEDSKAQKNQNTILEAIKKPDKVENEATRLFRRFKRHQESVKEIDKYKNDEAKLQEIATAKERLHDALVGINQ